MSRTVRVLPEAEAELAEAARWYEGRRTGLGAELMAHVDRALEELAESPAVSPRWVEGLPFRRRTLRRFPLCILYTFCDAEVRVQAFAHTKRRPGYWLNR